MLITRISGCKDITFLLNDKALWLIYFFNFKLAFTRKRMSKI